MADDTLREQLIEALGDILPADMADAWTARVVDTLLPPIREHTERAVEQARADERESIAQALIDRAAKAGSRRGTPPSQEQFLNGRLSAFQEAVDVARQHARKEATDG